MAILRTGRGLLEGRILYPSGLTAALILVLVFMAPILIPLGGCDEENDLPSAPMDCIEQKPVFGTLHLQITINAENPTVTVTVYRGNYDDGIVVATEPFTSETGSIDLEVDDTYSATARYKRGEDTILVLDEGYISTSSEEFRDATCWSVHDGYVDLRLETAAGQNPEE